jgi:hypothetical protein
MEAEPTPEELLAAATPPLPESHPTGGPTRTMTGPGSGSSWPTV